MIIETARPGSTPLSPTHIELHLVPEGDQIMPCAMPEGCEEAFRRSLAASCFLGREGDMLSFATPEGSRTGRILILGIGPDALDMDAFERAGAYAVAAANLAGADVLDLVADGLSSAQAVRAAMGASLAAYRFTRRTTPDPKSRGTLKHLRILAESSEDYESLWLRQAPVARAISFARDQVSEPANILHPQEFARRIADLSGIGLEVHVMGENALERLGMGALLAVGRGSSRESQVVTMRWRGAAPDQAPLAFVGKGVCFDSGGLSIKPCEHMADMKWDMAGAAAVVGAMHALAGRNARLNAVGVVGLVENMPDGNAVRPGDVLTSFSGKTIEVIDTDAEGRLVLADLLAYVEREHRPSCIVDIATLTGAAAIALADTHAGLFANDNDLAKQLLAAGDSVGERVWRLPLAKGLKREISSQIADVKNYGSRAGDAISAALFLHEFVADVRWAHVDMAAMAWRDERTPWPAGSTGFGVRLLDAFAALNET